MKRLRTTCAAALLAACCSAQAALVTQQREFVLAGTTGWIDAAGHVQVSRTIGLDFDRFDASLGTLTGAHWVLQSLLRVQAQGEVTGNGFDATGGDLQFWISAYTSDAFGAPALQGASSALGAYEQRHGRCTVSLQTSMCDVALSAEVALDALQAADDLAGLVGDGAFTQHLAALLDVRAVPDALTSMHSTGSFVWDDQALRGGIGRLTLVYDYAPHRPLAEPGGLALLGLGTLAWTRRRRR